MNRTISFKINIFLVLLFMMGVFGLGTVYADEIMHDTIAISPEQVDAEYMYGDAIDLEFTLQTNNINYLEYYYVQIYNSSNKEVFYYRGKFDRANGTPYTASYTVSLGTSYEIGTYRVKAYTTYDKTGTTTYFEVKDRVCSHVIVTDPGYAATYMNEGLTEGTHCALCGEVLTEQTVIKRLALPFKDVPEYSWYANAVRLMLDRGIMNGLSATVFGPSGNLTRAQLVVMLWNFEGYPETTYTNAFLDVPDGKYYTKAVEWAKQTGVVNGSNGRFYPGSTITRQDFAVILRNYAAYKQLDTQIADADAYMACSDYKAVSSYARSSIQWAYERGLIGANGALSPKKSITRAEAAAMLQRFLLFYEL